MMIRSLLAAACAIGLTACQSTPSNQISLSPTTEGAFTGVQVQMTFQGDASGVTDLTFPETWGPEENLSALRSNLTAVAMPDGVPLEVQSDKGQVSIAHAPGQHVRVLFDIAQDYDGEPAWGVQRVPGMRPVLQPAYATLIGETFLPDLTVDGPWTVTLSAFGDQAVAFSQPLSSDGATTDLPWKKISGGVLTLGDFRYTETTAHPLNIRTAIRGEWVLSDTKVSSIAASALGSASALFDDAPFEQYFIAINHMPPVEGGSAAIGTGLNESFFVLATPDADEDTLTHLIAHELIHEWIARRLGTSDEPTDPSRMWFVEGFTEYFSQRILLSGDHISSDTFVANFDTLLSAYQASSERAAPNADMNDRLWDSPEMQRLPYQRGALLALHWDTQLRGQGRSLEAVIAAMIKDADEERAETGEAIFNDADIYDALHGALGERFASDYKTYIETGQPLDMSKLTLPSCMTVQPRASSASGPQLTPAGPC